MADDKGKSPPPPKALTETVKAGVDLQSAINKNMPEQSPQSGKPNTLQTAKEVGSNLKQSGVTFAKDTPAQSTPQPSQQKIVESEMRAANARNAQSAEKLIQNATSAETSRPNIPPPQRNTTAELGRSRSLAANSSRPPSSPAVQPAQSAAQQTRQPSPTPAVQPAQSAAQQTRQPSPTPAAQPAQSAAQQTTQPKPAPSNPFRNEQTARPAQSTPQQTTQSKPAPPNPFHKPAPAQSMNKEASQHNLSAEQNGRDAKAEIGQNKEKAQSKEQDKNRDKGKDNER